MLESGLSNDFGSSETSRNRVVQALNSSGLIGIWKTTSYDEKHKVKPKAVPTDNIMSNLVSGRVLDISWTRELDPKLYWDPRHFREPVNRVMNEQMLELLGARVPTRISTAKLDGIERLAKSIMVHTLEYDL